MLIRSSCYAARRVGNGLAEVARRPDEGLQPRQGLMSHNPSGHARPKCMAWYGEERGDVSVEEGKWTARGGEGFLGIEGGGGRVHPNFAAPPILAFLIQARYSTTSPIRRYIHIVLALPECSSAQESRVDSIRVRVGSLAPEGPLALGTSLSKQR